MLSGVALTIMQQYGEGVAIAIDLLGMDAIYGPVINYVEQYGARALIRLVGTVGSRFCGFVGAAIIVASFTKCMMK